MGTPQSHSEDLDLPDYINDVGSTMAWTLIDGREVHGPVRPAAEVFAAQGQPPASILRRLAKRQPSRTPDEEMRFQSQVRAKAALAHPDLQIRLLRDFPLLRTPSPNRWALLERAGRLLLEAEVLADERALKSIAIGVPMNEKATEVIGEAYDDVARRELQRPEQGLTSQMIRDTLSWGKGLE